MPLHRFILTSGHEAPWLCHSPTANSAKRCASSRSLKASRGIKMPLNPDHTYTSPLRSRIAVIFLQGRSLGFSGVTSRTPSGANPDVHVLTVFVVGRRLKITILSTTRSMSPMTIDATTNLSSAFTTWFGNKTGNGKVILSSKAQAPATKKKVLLWNML